MKIYQFIFLTLSTVSIIHCSQPSNQNEDSKSTYHIEFEDKRPEGGYGYKIQVSGKSKYAEIWKKNQKPVPTTAPIATGTLDYSQNNYPGSSDNFAPKLEPLTKPVQNNFAHENYFNNPVDTKQYSSKPALQPSSQNSVSLKSQEITTAPTLSSGFVAQSKPNFANVPKQQFRNTPKQAPVNNFVYVQQANKPEQQLESQKYSSNKTPVQYVSSNDFVPINFQESKPESSLSSQNSFTSNQDWQVSKPSLISSSQYSNKPSLQIMNSDSSKYVFPHYGPQVYVESTSGKVNHNQFTQFSNQFDPKQQVTLPSEADLSKYFLQNPEIVYQDSGKSTVDTPVPIKYYQSADQFDYKTLVNANQYASQVSDEATKSNNTPLKQSTQFELPSSGPLNQYGTIQGISFGKDQYASHIPSVNIQEAHKSNYYQFGGVSSVPFNQYNTIEGIYNTKHSTALKANQYAAQVPAVPLSHTVHVQDAPLNFQTQYGSAVPSFLLSQYSTTQGKDNTAQKSNQYSSQIPAVPLSHTVNIQEAPLNFQTQYGSAVPSFLLSEYTTIQGKDSTAQKSNQYSSQVPAVPLSHTVNVQEAPLNFQSQYGSAVPSFSLSQYSNVQGKDSAVQKASQYTSQVPSVHLQQTVNIHDTPLNFPTQYGPAVPSIPLNQYSNIKEITYSKESTVQKPSSSVQNAAQISTVPQQEIKHPKGKAIQKFASSSVKAAPQYVPENSKENNLYKQLPQYASVPLTHFATLQELGQSEANQFYNSQYASQGLPLPQPASQESVKYVPQQIKDSVQLPIDYSQLLKQYPQFSQESLASLQTESKDIPQPNLYNAVQQPIANKQVVSYHYKQELPPKTSQTNNLKSPNAQYAALNSYNPKDLANTYNGLLSGYGQQSLSGLGSIGHGIPLSPYGVYGNIGATENGNGNHQTGNGNHQILRAPGLTYGYGSNIHTDHQGLLNVDGYNNIPANGQIGGFQLVNVHNNQRRSSGKVDNGKKKVADQKQTE